MYETKNPVFKMPSKSDVKASQKGHVVSAGAEHGETPLVSTLMHHADGATTLQTFNNANVLGGVYSVQDLPVTSTCIPVGNLALLRRFLYYPYAVAAGTWPTGLVFCARTAASARRMRAVSPSHFRHSSRVVRGTTMWKVTGEALEHARLL